MQPPHQHSRINLAELKAQIVRKLGPDGSKQYFHYLNRLLSLKISKTEFNKLCARILGRDNIPLHNQFIRSILKNATCAKVPPPRNENQVSTQSTAVANKAPPSDSIEQNGPHVAAGRASYQPGLSNGDILPLSPRKTRKSFHDHRATENHCAFGPSGKTNSTLPQPKTIVSSDFNMIQENGDLHGTVQHHQGLMQRIEHDRGAVLTHDPAKSSAIKTPQDIPVSVHNKDQFSEEIRDRSLLQAPLGVPLCTVSVGGARRALPLVATSSMCVSTSSCGALLDSINLRERINQIATEHGLEGVSVDCANLLNSGLDSYLKGLIRSCVKLIGARSGHGTMKNNTVKHQAYTKPVNGIRPGHHLQLSNNSRPSELIQEPLPHSQISLQDFRIAMEMNPQQLGEDWPLLLEKICTHASDEYV